MSYQNFSDLPISESILSKLKSQGLVTPTPIQALAIPMLCKSSDHYILQAETGTGKTAAFLIPLLQKIDTSKKGVQALILSPTRELAKQIEQAIFSLSPNRNIKSALLIGGSPMFSQLQKIKKGPHILVGTPGRVIDHLIKQNSIKLSFIEQLVLDEADEMMDMGFVDDIKTVIEHSNSNKKLLWISATMPKNIVQLADALMPGYRLLNAKKSTTKKSLTKQSYIIASPKRKYTILRELVEKTDDIYAVIFCRTKKDVDEMRQRLKSDDIHATAIHGDMPQRKRERNLEQLKKRKTHLLIATDVAARGLHVDELTHVINYALPDNLESYVHRIGRTGRAGKSGHAINFILPSEENKIPLIESISATKMQEHDLSDKTRTLSLKPAATFTKKRSSSRPKKSFKKDNRSFKKAYQQPKSSLNDKNPSEHSKHQHPKPTSYHKHREKKATSKTTKQQFQKQPQSNIIKVRPKIYKDK